MFSIRWENEQRFRCDVAVAVTANRILFVDRLQVVPGAPLYKPHRARVSQRTILFLSTVIRTTVATTVARGKIGSSVCPLRQWLYGRRTANHSQYAEWASLSATVRHGLYVIVVTAFRRIVVGIY